VVGLITIAGVSIVVGISFIVDASGTLKLVINIITVRGVTWVIKRVIGSIDKNKSDLLNFTGWSIAGISMVGILKNAKIGIKPIIEDIGETMDTLGKIKDSVKGFKGSLDGFADWLEKITFWN
jgi:hypothetical protein